MKSYDLRLKTKSTITISGPSQCGKSTLVSKIVRQRHELFDEPISQVLWYSAYPPSKKLSDVIYITGAPYDLHDRIIPQSLVIVDDFMDELKNWKGLTDLMTKTTHHKNITLIFITQNMFHSGSQNKTRRLNSAYKILFKNPQDIGTIMFLGREMFPQDKQFLSQVFTHVTQSSPFSYILCDSHMTTPEHLRVRSHITELPMYAYISHTTPIENI